MTLVDDDVAPPVVCQELAVVHADFIAGTDNWKFELVLVLHLQVLSSHLSSFIFRAVVHDCPDVWRPSCKLLDPVVDCAEWSCDQEGSRDVLFFEECNHGDRLNGLAQTHLVCKNTA